MISKGILASLLFCVFTFTAEAQIVHRRPKVVTQVSNYVMTHKTVLAADAVGWLAMSADLASSVHCQKIGYRFISPVDPAHTGCIETDPWLGPHPSERAYWFYGGGFEIAFTALRHLGWHYAPSPGGRYFVEAFVTVPTVAISVADTYTNIDAAEALQKNMQSARMRFLSDRLVR